MSPRSAEIDAFWQAFRRYTGLDHDNYVVGSFGDSPKMATELAGLVIAGIKRATASLARDYDDGRDLLGQRQEQLFENGRASTRICWRSTLPRRLRNE
jgi:uncharacterized protein YhfF